MDIANITVKPNPPFTNREQEISFLLADPHEWKRMVLAARRQSESHKYFITFTKTPDVNENDWYDRLRYEMQRKFVRSYSIYFEHLHTNMHAHCLLESYTLLKKSREYKTFEKKFGYVDIKRVTVDNGIINYAENIVYDDRMPQTLYDLFQEQQGREP